MEADPDRIVADGQLTMTDASWEQAKSRAAVIGALAKRRVTGIAAADEAAMKLGVSRRHVYLLLGRYRQGSGLVTDLALHRSTGVDIASAQVQDPQPRAPAAEFSKSDGSIPGVSRHVRAFVNRSTEQKGTCA